MKNNYLLCIVLLIMSAYSFALKTDGTLWGWGLNTNGKLGDGTTVGKSSPVQIGQLTNWKQVSGQHAIQSPDLP